MPLFHLSLQSSLASLITPKYLELLKFDHSLYPRESQSVLIRLLERVTDCGRKEDRHKDLSGLELSASWIVKV